MTSEELGQKFDVLFNAIASNQCPELDAYEKSVFLTLALNEVIRAFFTPIANKIRLGFDDGSIRESDFSSLLKTSKITTFNDSSLLHLGAKTCSLPEDFFLRINELVNDIKNNYMFTVLPIHYSKYSVLMLKPYKYPPKDLVWRIVTNEATPEGEVELVGVFKNDAELEYVLRYLKKPNPIIVDDLPEDLTIENKHTVLNLNLPDHVYDIILNRAIELAKASYLSVDEQRNASVAAALTLGLSGTEATMLTGKGE